MSWTRTSSALVALPCGVLLTGLGAGVGGRFVAKAGLSAGTLLGFTLLVAGLALLGFATRVLWRRLHGRARLWLVPGGAVVVVLVLQTALAGMYTVAPRGRLGARTPAAAGLRYRDVVVRTADGVRLSGWYVPSRNGAALVLRHGAGSTRTAVLPQAAVLGRAGYGLLLLDARGHGRSGGRGMDLGWYGDQDVTAAVSFLARRAGVDPHRIGLVGLSMGGEEAVGAAAADPRVRAVVAEGATSRTAADKATWLPGGPAGTVQRMLDRYTYGLTDLLTPTGPPTTLGDAVRTASGARFLLVTAGAEPDELLAAERFRAEAPGRVAVWTVDGASHTGGLRTAPVSWSRRVTRFLDRTLRDQP